MTVAVDIISLSIDIDTDFGYMRNNKLSEIPSRLVSYYVSWEVCFNGVMRAIVFGRRVRTLIV
jgi:hypothetical protein